MKLCKAGYGTVESILDTPVNLVMKMIHYENFCSEYERTFLEMNKE